MALGSDVNVTKSQNSVAIGWKATSNKSSNAFIGGYNATSVNSDNTVVVGRDANITDSHRAIATGANATVSSSKNAIATGSNVTINSSESALVLGDTAKAINSEKAIVSGFKANADRSKRAIVQGALSKATNSNYSIVNGVSAKAINSEDAIVSGGTAEANNSKSAVVLGNESNATTSENAFVGGNQASATTSAGALVLGNGAKAENAAGSVVLGEGAKSSISNGVALGSTSTAQVDKLQTGDGLTDNEIQTKIDAFKAVEARLLTELQAAKQDYETKEKTYKDAKQAELFKLLGLPNVGLNAAPTVDSATAEAQANAAKVTYETKQAELKDKRKKVSTWLSTAAAVSLGDEEEGITRQLNNLAAGTKDTDAVNVAQLKSLKNAGLTFAMNDYDAQNKNSTQNKLIKTEIGHILQIQGKSSFVYNDTNKVNYASDNLVTFNDAGVLRIGMLKSPSFTGVTLGEGDKTVSLTADDGVLKAGGKTIFTEDNFKTLFTKLYTFEGGLKTEEKNGKTVVSLDKEAIKQMPELKGERGERGLQGERGERGLQGERGERGLQGEQGDRGPQGEQGSKGERGEQGLKGEKGERGLQGERGEQGLQGERGEQGLQGERGEQGLKGEKGERGLKGEKGDQGNRGPQGEQGSKGERGERGLQGERGEQGLKGEKGERGLKGEKGDQGNRGPQGEQGSKGERGEQGLKGEKGERGLKGEKGDQGKSAYESWKELPANHGKSEAEFAEMLGGSASKAELQQLRTEHNSLKAQILKDQQSIQQLDRNMQKMNKDLRAGIAGATAIAFLQGGNFAGDSAVSVAVGTYKGEHALAVGYGRRLTNNKIEVKLGASVNSRSDVNAGGSVGYHW
ncbi:YadA-like family protein [Haemophilus parahaemolyticus]